MIHMDTPAHVYVSPHLDDAVFSCAGRMWGQVQAGDPVAVVTLFAGVPDPASPFSPYAHELHARWGRLADAVEQRRMEDVAALAHLGVEPIHWDYPDCIYRTTPEGDHMYASEEALWGPIHPADRGLVEELADGLEALFLSRTITLYVPLGVGGHVDHRIARAAAERCGYTRACYEDFPYAADSEHLDAALDQLRWASELVPISPEGLAAKIDAIARYRSQISTFWVDKDDMAAKVRAFAQRIGGGSPAERYWWPMTRD